VPCPIQWSSEGLESCIHITNRYEDRECIARKENCIVDWTSSWGAIHWDWLRLQFTGRIKRLRYSYLRYSYLGKKRLLRSMVKIKWVQLTQIYKNSSLTSWKTSKYLSLKRFCWFHRKFWCHYSLMEFGIIAVLIVKPCEQNDKWHFGKAIKIGL